MSDKTRADNLALALRNCEGEVTALRAERDRYREALESVCNVGDRAAVMVAREALSSEAAKR